MINTRENFSCGSDSGELYKHLSTSAYIVYLMECTQCDKILMNMDESREGSALQGSFKRFAYFKCSCGKKYKRVVFEISDTGTGYRCNQGMVTKEETPHNSMRRKMVKRPPAYFVKTYLSRGRTLTYKISPESIKYRLGGVKNG